MIGHRLAPLLLVSLAVAVGGSAAAVERTRTARLPLTDVRLVGAEPGPDRTDDRAHGAHRSALGSVDEVHLGAAGKRVRRSRSSVRLPLRRPRWNRIGPQARACHRQEKGRPPPQHGPVRISRRKSARSLGNEPTQPGTPGAPGTADPAKLPRSHPPARRMSLGALEKRFHALERREARLERMAEQFDEWESCLSWIPVTEYGDPERRFGYIYEVRAKIGLSAGDCGRPQRVGRPRLHVLGR